LLVLLAVWGMVPDMTSAQGASRSGTFHIIWKDSPRGPRVAPPPVYFLVDGTQWTQVLADDRMLAPLGGALALNRRRVRVTGTLTRIPGMTIDRMTAQAIQIEEPRRPAAPEAVAGPQAWVNILCRFSDSPTVTPRSASYVQGLMGTSYPGLDHYWREQSYNLINLTGTAVFGWYNLPQPRSYYLPGGNADLNSLANDCAGVADADVYFPSYIGINFMFNQELDGYSWGGSGYLNIDGQGRTYRMTWLAPWCYESQGCLGHEMGHGFGMPHSSGPYAATYDSRWDVMSNVWDNCPPYDPTYGCIGVHTISYHKDISAWVGARKLVPSWGFRGSVYLERIAQPPTGSNYLMIQIPVPGTATKFYTIETRRRVGYDATLPGDAVIMHLVDTTNSRPARVVDVDGNGDPNDAAAMWIVGETFFHKANALRMRVLSGDSQAFTVAVAYGPGDDTAGVYNPVSGTFFLRNTNSAGAADVTFQYGPANAGWAPLMGDWNGDGTDTVGVYNPVSGTFFLRNTNSAGPADVVFQYGPANAGWVPLVGDWNGDGTDTVGMYNPTTGTFFLRNSNTAGPASLTFSYGPGGAGWYPLTGDWNGDVVTTVGVYNPSTGQFFLKNTNAAGSADTVFAYGPGAAGFIPRVGDWNDQ
jgi:M6 family metalloprotease-like protein